MKNRFVKLINVLFVSNLLLSIVLFPAPGRAQAAEAAPSASAQRTTIIVVDPYLPFQTSVTHIQDTWSGTLPNPMTYTMSNMEYVSNVIYTPTGGATCQLAENVITCTGVLTKLVISFDFTYIATDYEGTCIWFGFNGTTTFATDYTIQMTYPAPIIYISSGSVAPTSHIGNTITWYQANSYQLPGMAKFSDPRVKVLNLPLVMR